MSLKWDFVDCHVALQTLNAQHMSSTFGLLGDKDKLHFQQNHVLSVRYITYCTELLL